MIARMWHGRIPKERAEEYHKYLTDTGLNDYKTTDGNRGVFLLKKDEGAIAHIYTLTFWDCYESIKKFAGDDYEKARYYPEDQDFLFEFEPLVSHFDVMESPDYMNGLM